MTKTISELSMEQLEIVEAVERLFEDYGKKGIEVKFTDGAGRFCGVSIGGIYYHYVAGNVLTDDVSEGIIFNMLDSSDYRVFATVTMQFNKGKSESDQRLEELSEEHGISVTTLTEIMDNDHMTDIDALEELLETKFIIHMNEFETRSEEKIVGEHFAEEDGTMNYLDERNLINFFDFEDYGRNLLFDYTMFVDTESSDTWQIVLIPNY